MLIRLISPKGPSYIQAPLPPKIMRIYETAFWDLKSLWMLTYDNAPEIRMLYKARRQFSFDINYSAQIKRVDKELLISSKGLRVTEELRSWQVHRPQYRKNTILNKRNGLINGSKPWMTNVDDLNITRPARPTFEVDPWSLNAMRTAENDDHTAISKGVDYAV